MFRGRRVTTGFTLIELMIVIAIIAIIAAIAIPGLLSSQRAANERNASTSLKTLTSAEADFRANDRDFNHVMDYWTANVSGLYTMTSAAVIGNTANSTTDPSIKLIELSVASADTDSSLVGAGGENVALSNFAVSSPKAGYWYGALMHDANFAAGADWLYAQDTAGTPTMGSVHHSSKFGFVAFPDSQAAGKYVFMVNENNTIFRSATSGPFRLTTATPPGPMSSALPSPYQNFPADANLKSYWSKLD